MNIILLERVEKLGQMGEFVSVKSGYARNFLLPQGKAVFASKENIKMFEEKKSQLEGENITRKKEAQNLADNINFKEVILIRAASESGQLYGSVSAKDISNAVTDAGLSINKSQVDLNKALKTLSYEDISIKLHPEVSVSIQLNTARPTAEAKAQTRSATAIAGPASGAIRASSPGNKASAAHPISRPSTQAGFLWRGSGVIGGVGCGWNN